MRDSGETRQGEIQNLRPDLLSHLQHLPGPSLPGRRFFFMEAEPWRLERRRW